MFNLSRWLAPVVLAAGVGILGLAPGAAHANDGDDLVRVLVNAADVIFSNGQPYYQDDYRNNRRGHSNRLKVVRDNRGNTRYYRSNPRRTDRDVKCNKHGKCHVRTTYYDPRYDRDRNRYRGRHDYNDRRYYSQSNRGWGDHDH